MTVYVMRGGMLVDKATGLPTPDVSDGMMGAHVVSDLPGYFSVASNRWVEGRSARRDDLARTGCRPAEPDEAPKYCHTEKWARRLGLDHQAPPPASVRTTTIGPTHD